jgi:hypothetical protein
MIGSAKSLKESRTALWPGLDCLIAAAPPTANYHAHGIGPLVAWRLREQGEPVLEALQESVRRSAYAAVTAAPLLQRIREAVSGPIIVLKGPEIAAAYPSPALRPYGDLDLLVPNLERAEAELLSAGFKCTGSEHDILPNYIHDLPLRFAHLPLAIELHRRPGWLSWMHAPSNDALFHIAVPSATGVDGVLALPPVEHTLFLAVHSWRHGPYHSLLHLIDIALMREQTDPGALAHTAQAWGLQNLWNRTTATIDRLFYDGTEKPDPLDALWSRHLNQIRPRTRWEYYLATRTNGLAAPTLPARISAVTRDILATFTLRPGETPRSLATYTLRQLRHPNHPPTTRTHR